MRYPKLLEKLGLKMYVVQTFKKLRVIEWGIEVHYLVFSFSILNVLYEFPSPHASVTNNKTKLNVEFEIYCNKTKCEFTFYEIAVHHIRQVLNTSKDNYYSNLNYVNIRYHELKLIIGWWLLMYSLFALNMNYKFIF